MDEICNNIFLKALFSQFIITAFRGILVLKKKRHIIAQKIKQKGFFFSGMVFLNSV